MRLVISLGSIPTLVASALALQAPAAVAQSDGTEEGEEQSFWQSLKDPEDGMLDLTAGGMGGASGFVPLVVPFNDPAIGAGALLAGAYFHPREETDDPDEQLLSSNPPSMSFGGAAGTDNGTWVAGGGHSHNWNDGRIRYTGLLGVADVHLKFYGIGGASETPDSEGLTFTIAGTAMNQQLKLRLGNSNFYGGVKYTFLASDVDFDVMPTEPLAIGRSKDAGLGVYVDFDNRDNTFTPNKGTRANLSIGRFDDALGGDFDYNKAGGVLNRYWQLGANDRLTFGLRAEYRYADDDAPFYSLPFVMLRGIPALRYLGNHAATVEIEPRYRIGTRWSVLAFTGAGRAAQHFDELGDAEKAYNYGAGFRYLLSRTLGLGAGLDIAIGPEEGTVYLTFGSAWGGFL